MNEIELLKNESLKYKDYKITEIAEGKDNFVCYLEPKENNDIFEVYQDLPILVLDKKTQK